MPKRADASCSKYGAPCFPTGQCTFSRRGPRQASRFAGWPKELHCVRRLDAARELEELSCVVRLRFRRATRKLWQSYSAVKNFGHGRFALRHRGSCNSDNTTGIKDNTNSNVPLPPSGEIPKSRSSKFIDCPSSRLCQRHGVQTAAFSELRSSRYPTCSTA